MLQGKKAKCGKMRRSRSRRLLRVRSGSKWTLTITRMESPEWIETMWSRPWHVMTCEITAPSRKSFLLMQMADPPAFRLSLEKSCVFSPPVFWTFSMFCSLSWISVFFHSFYPLIVFFECISFWRFSWIWLTFLCLFSFLLFTYSPFFSKKKSFSELFPFLLSLFFARKTRCFLLLSSCFFAKESELRDKNLISLEEFILPVNFLKANDIIILSKPRKRDVFLFSAQLWRCWRSQLALSYSK